MSTSLFDGLPEERFGREQNGQIIGSGMEGYECAVGGGAPDNYAADAPFSGDYRMDETHRYDFFKTDGGKRRGLL